MRQVLDFMGSRHRWAREHISEMSTWHPIDARRLTDTRLPLRSSLENKQIDRLSAHGQINRP